MDTMESPLDFLARVYSDSVIWTDNSTKSALITKPYVAAVMGEWEVRDYADDWLRVWYTPEDVCVDAMTRLKDETWSADSLMLAAESWFAYTDTDKQRRYEST